MKYMAIALSEMGKIRKNNEDNLFFDGSFRSTAGSAESFRKSLSSQESVKLFALCDGMGGEAMGEQASYMAVSGLKEIEAHFKKDGGRSFPKLMPRYLNRVNEAICQIIRNNKGRRMGSTFASLILKGNVAQSINVGDSRVYLFRHAKLTQLSVDHTYAQRLVEMGIISQEEAALHPEKNRLTQHLGLFKEEAKIQPALSPEIWIQEGDYFLICTDGMTEMLSEANITEILRSPLAFMQQAENLMQRALHAGGKDNISLILIKILELDETGEEESEPLLSQALLSEAAAPAVLASAAPIIPNEAPTPVPEAVLAPTSSYKEIIQSEPAMPLLGDTAPVPSVKEAVISEKAAETVAPPAYELSEDEIRRFEEARQAALERQQALRGSAAVTAPGTSAGAVNKTQAILPTQARKEDPRKRKLRGPSTAHIIGRAILLFVLFSIIGAALIFILMNIDALTRFFNDLFGL